MLVEVPYVFPCHENEFCYQNVVVDDVSVQSFRDWQRDHLPDFNDGSNDFFSSWAIFLLLALSLTLGSVGLILGTIFDKRSTFGPRSKIGKSSERLILFSYDEYGEIVHAQELVLPDENETTDNDNYDPGNGYMLVINNRFLNHPIKKRRRKYTKKSENDLRNTFETFGFKVRLERDVALNRMYELFDETIQELNNNDYSCLVLWILSHGIPKRLVEMEDGNHVSAEDLPWIFNNDACPQMSGKPRLFFINSCDGSQNNEAIALESDCTKEDVFPEEPKYNNADKSRSVPNDVDYLITYATTPYALAYRDEAKGCFFVHDFCKAVLSQWEDDDLQEI